MREDVEKECGRVNMMQILCAHVCKWKNDTCWHHSNTGVGGKKKNGGGVNSSMIYLVYCNNFCKSHNVPTPCTTIKTKKKNLKKLEVF
jgi:hypothetical protein